MDILENYMNYIVFGILVVFGILIGRRYNIVLGLLSIVFNAFLLHFILLETGWVSLDFVLSIKGLNGTLDTINQYLVLPIKEVIGLGLDKIGKSDIKELTVSNKWIFALIYCGLYTAILIISHAIKPRPREAY